MADVQPITSWSSTSANNKPSGTDVIGAGMDDNLREIEGQVATWRDGLAWGELNLAGVTGTNSIAGSTSPAPGLAAGQKYWFTPQATNTGPTFLNVNAAGFKSIFSGGATCVGGEIQISVPASVSYDGTNFHLRGKGPFIDSSPLVQGSSDQTKKWKVEVDGFTPATTRTFTPPDQDLIITTITAKGDVWVGASTGTMTTKAVGADGTFLRADSASTGGVTWAGSVGMVKLATGTVSVQATVDIVMTAYTAYPNKRLVYTLIPANDGVSLTARISTDGGSTYDSGAAAYSNCVDDEDNTAVQPRFTSDSTLFQISANNVIGNSVTEGCSGVIEMFDTTNTARWPQFRWEQSYVGSNATPQVGINRGMGVRRAAQDTDAFRLLFSTGNTASGSWTLYGYG